MLSSPSTTAKKSAPACWRESRSAPGYVPKISKVAKPANNPLHLTAGVACGVKSLGLCARRSLAGALGRPHGPVRERGAMSRAHCWFVVAMMMSLAIACNKADGPNLVGSCSDPVPLNGTFDPAAPGYVVYYRQGVNAVSETNRLAALYGFEPTHVYDQVRGFSAELTMVQLEQVRCEPTVASTYYNGVAYPNGVGVP